MPPYLRLDQGTVEPIVPENFKIYDNSPPHEPIAIGLAGEDVHLRPGDADALVGRHFTDTESLLAMHRFAWIPQLADGFDPAWIAEIWRAWATRHGQPSDSWAWHPYTAAERLINILDFVRTHGLPASTPATTTVLMAHGPAILAGLEYFGDVHTGNHLANNGRGLYLGGLALGRNDWVKAGRQILEREAIRIFGESGVLAEGSSHYHLLTTRWYAECWLAARRHNRSEAENFERIVVRALAVARKLILPGGLALIGDVSPDSPPDYLSCLATDLRNGWLASICDADYHALMSLRARATIDEPSALARDGWLRIDSGAWSVLGFASPDGWQPMPGHGHYDFGSFELHHGTTPIVCDLGRRSYGPSGYQDMASAAHATIEIDGYGPYPANRPYYTPDFRHRVAGPPLERSVANDRIALQTDAFSRLKDVGSWRRELRFADHSVTITDRVEGRGTHRIVRYLHTSLEPTQDGSGLSLGRYGLQAQGDIAFKSVQRWRAYGIGDAATSIAITTKTELPWESKITIQVPS